MNTLAKYCDTCQVQVIDKDSSIITSYLHLIKGCFDCYICIDCWNVGRYKFYENDGFRQVGYKVADDKNKLFDNLK